MTEVLPWVFVATTAIGLVGVLSGCAGFAKYAWVACIFFASTSYLLIPITAGGLSSAYGWWIVGGLVGCWWGDIFGCYGHFIPSVIAFLLGHVAFSFAFYVKGIELSRIWTVLPVILLVAVTILVWIMPYIKNPSERVAVFAYCLVISTMLTCAFGAAEGLLGKVILAGAVAFFISDIFVARGKFVPNTSYNWLGCYPLYYLSCVLMGLTVVVYRKTE